MSDKTDKELLELAAKAAGYQLQRMCDPAESGYVGSEFFHLNGRYWNPLTDDGDSFRLAVNLGIDILPTWGDKCCAISVGGDSFFECMSKDQYTATRRAIVRAAAAIGEKL